MRRKSNVLGKVVLIIAALGFSIVLLNTLFTAPVSLKNTTKVFGHFESLERNRPARGDLNYDLYLSEDNNHYKIGTNWADCFFYEDFANEVKRGQSIELLVRKVNGFMNKDLSLVVSIKSGDRVYLNPDCVNEGLKNQKIIMPFLGLGVLTGIFLLYKYKFSVRKS